MIVININELLIVNESTGELLEAERVAEQEAKLLAISEQEEANRKIQLFEDLISLEADV